MDKASSTGFDNWARLMDGRSRPLLCWQLCLFSCYKRLYKLRLTDRWEAVNDFIIRIERVTTNLNRSRKGIKVPNLFKTEPNGTRDIVPLTAIFEDLAGKRFLDRKSVV